MVETRAKSDQKITNRKRKHSALEEGCDDYEDDFECADCGRRSQNMFMCGQCHATTYCNELCQERDWDNHQKHCIAQVD